VKTPGDKRMLLQLILRLLGISGTPGSLANVSKQDLAIILAAVRRLRQEQSP